MEVPRNGQLSPVDLSAKHGDSILRVVLEVFGVDGEDR